MNLEPLPPELADKAARLRAILRGLDGAVIAMSGGVDSTLLVHATHAALGDRALAVTADSPSLPRRELREAEELARLIGVRHLVITTDEVADPRYAANPANRCYFCKRELFTRLRALADEYNLPWVLYGDNLDDLGDHRPGAQAALEHGVRAPLKEAGLTKADIRALARWHGLPVWDKPAFACLGSRFPYGTPITPAKLAQVEAAEEVLRELGLRQYRVRHHGDLARIEVEAADMPRLVERAVEVVERIRAAAGFRHVTLDLAGYRRGSLNEGLDLTVALEPAQRGRP
ncbi:MAG: ATP-dependent sacrificial sulfur transferase LarE [Oscillochloridaceae bacterium]|nr:ATP-dependent sacrificial sulfur transferase LarE [Chloroflexaceae bacterium]MDW8388959.1 ATP-dependent sacrificial sulfur transferase LarE [Oscillochloridaceae bacterium]